MVQSYVILPRSIILALRCFDMEALCVWVSFAKRVLHHPTTSSVVAPEIGLPTYLFSLRPIDRFSSYVFFTDRVSSNVSGFWLLKTCIKNSDCIRISDSFADDIGNSYRHLCGVALFPALRDFSGSISFPVSRGSCCWHYHFSSHGSWCRNNRNNSSLITFLTNSLLPSTQYTFPNIRQ